jgi:hypothetical protein
MSNIYERIGEALLSNGKHDIIRAENKHEEDVLTKAGFTKVGSIKEGDKVVALFKIEQKTKEVIKVVEVPTKEKQWPYNEQNPFRKPDPGIWYYNDHNPLYTYGTSTGDPDWTKYTGKTVSDAGNSYSGKGFYTNNTADLDYSYSIDLYQSFIDRCNIANDKTDEKLSGMTNILNQIAKNTESPRNI